MADKASNAPATGMIPPKNGNRFPFIDRTGQRFGRLMVIAFAGREPRLGRRWLCLCDCGKEKIVSWNGLSRDQHGTRSCGCLAEEWRKTGKRPSKPSGVAAFNALLGQYQRSARARGYVFALTKEEFRAVVEAPCTYCGECCNLAMSVGAGASGEYRYTGIDRIDNALGYVSGNVCSCCKQCNIAKGTLSREEFLRWAEYAYAHWIGGRDE
jgi:hypothetical protein